MEDNSLVEKYNKLISGGLGNEEIKELSLNYIEKHYRSYPLKVSEIIDGIIDKDKMAGDEAYLANLYYYKGWTQLDLGRYREASELFFKSLALMEECNDKLGVIRVLNSLGFCYSNMGNPLEAFKKFDQALVIAEDIDDAEAMAQIFANMGEGFLDLKQYNEALEYFNRSFSAGPSKVNIPIIMERIGYTYHLMGDHKTALTYLNRALEIEELDEMMGVKTEIFMVLGAIYKGLGNYDKAIEILNLAIEQAQNIHLPRIEAEASLILGNLLLEKGNHYEALGYFEKALNISVSINATSIKVDSLKSISIMFKEKRRWREAYDYLSEYHSEAQELFSQEAAKEIDRIKMNEAAREAETFKKMYQQIASISLIGREITSSLNLDEVVSTIYRNLNEITDSPILGLGLYDEEKKEVNYRFFIENGEWLTPFKVSVESEDSFGAWAINNQKEIVINDVKKEYSRYVNKITYTGGSEDERLNSLIYIPLILGNKVIGILSVQSYAKNAYDEYLIEVFKTLASYITIAVENAKLYEEVKALATKDPLTGLLNRSHFNELAEREFKKYKRYGKEFSVVMFDLDHFKKVNDSYGHDGGDIVLKEISLFLRNEIRCTDLFCRYGGEEFLILLPHTDLSQATILTKRLREGLENLKIDIVDGGSCSVTASFGISCIKPQDESLRALIKRADKALYESKGKGRNTITQSL